MENDLDAVEQLAGALLRQLSPAQRRTVMRRMSRDLQRSQRTRVAAQRDPDGNAFEPRRQQPPPTMGNHAVAFLYPSGGSGEPRLVVLKSYTWRNGMMTGFDIEAGGLRSFFKDKIVKRLPVPPEHQNASGGRLRRRGSLRRSFLFRKLASARYLRAEADDAGFWVGFAGRAAEVASIHQYGLRDRPSLKAKAMRYPERRLLGPTDADREMLLDAVFDHLAEFSLG